jgi:acyl transferase domain-containing protein
VEPFHLADSALFLISGSGPAAVRDGVRALTAQAGGPLAEVAAETARRVDPAAPARAALVAGSPRELAQRAGVLAALTEQPPAGLLARDPTGTVFWSASPPPVDGPRVGFLFPGQGCQRLNMGRALFDRFPWAKLMVREADATLAALGAPTLAERVYRPFGPAVTEAEAAAWLAELSEVEVAGPAILVTATLWARYLEITGVRPTAVGGHSQGEQAAFHAAGALDLRGLTALGAFLGRAGSAAYNDGPAGAMAVLACGREAAEELLRGGEGYAIVANVNAPAQVVVAGERAAVDRAAGAAAARGIEARPLPVSNAFHTRLVASGAAYMRRSGPALPPVGGALRARLFSCLDGAPVPPGTRPLDHFADMATRAVDFTALARAVGAEVDLLVEVGAGRALSGLVQAIEPRWTCLPVEPIPGRTRALHAVYAALFAAGAPVRWDIVFRGLGPR